MTRNPHHQGTFLPPPPSSFNNVVAPITPTPVLYRTNSVYPDALNQVVREPSPTSVAYHPTHQVAYHPTYVGVAWQQQCLPCDDLDDVVVSKPFLHPRKNKYEGPPASPIAKTKRNKKSPSPTLAKNEKYKTEDCTQWKQFGTCRFGDRCHFIHHEWERRSTGVVPSLPCFTAVSTGFW